MVLGASVLPAVCTTAIGDTRAHHAGVSINPLVSGHSHRGSTSGPCRMDSLRNLQIFCVTLYKHHVFFTIYHSIYAMFFTTTSLRTHHLSDVGHFFPSGFFPLRHLPRPFYDDVTPRTRAIFFPPGFFPSVISPYTIVPVSSRPARSREAILSSRRRSLIETSATRDLVPTRQKSGGRQNRKFYF